MKVFLCATAVLIALFGAITSATPVFEKSSVVEVDDAMWLRIPKTYTKEMNDNAKELESTKHIRSRRSPQSPQFNWTPPAEPPKTQIFATGSNSKSGTDIFAKAQTQVWQSNNKRHEINVQGSYGQHFGGPWGNSRPSYGGGAGYTFHF